MKHYTSAGKINLNQLSAALHYLEVGVCAAARAYDPTVPNRIRKVFEECGDDVAKLAQGQGNLILSSLNMPDPSRIATASVSAIDEAALVLNRFLAPSNAHPREVISADTHHTPLHGTESLIDDTLKNWRRYLGASNRNAACNDLAGAIFEGTVEWDGSKALLGVLGTQANPDIAGRLLSLLADDAFARDHLVPLMISRFRLHFMSTIATHQSRISVPFLDPRLSELCDEHVTQLANLIAQKAVGKSGYEPSQKALFSRVFAAAPLGLLALLSLQEQRKPNPKRLFAKVFDLREEINSMLKNRSLIAGQLINELDSEEKCRLDEWIGTVLPAASPSQPLWCRVVKSAVPMVSAVAGGIVGYYVSDGGMAPAGLNAGACYWISHEVVPNWFAEALNPEREHNIAIRNYANIREQWSKITAVESLDKRLVWSVKSVLGLDLEVS
jgi:hypothetical protein